MEVFCLNPSCWQSRQTMFTHSWDIRQAGWELLGRGYPLSIQRIKDDDLRKIKAFFNKLGNHSELWKWQKIAHLEPPEAIKSNTETTKQAEEKPHTCACGHRRDPRWSHGRFHQLLKSYQALLSGTTWMSGRLCQEGNSRVEARGWCAKAETRPRTLANEP